MKTPQLIRIKAIHNCLKNRKSKRWTWENLAEACAEALEYESIKNTTSERTIRADIKYMKKVLLAPIKPLRPSNKEKAYYVYTKDFELETPPISEEEGKEIQDALHILKQFKVFESFVEDIGQILAKVHTQPKEGKNIVRMEQVPNTPRRDLIGKFYTFIREQKVVQISYRPFHHKKAERYKVHPCFLQEYNNRWFLIARCEHQEYGDSISIYGLDRILGDPKILDKLFIPSPEVNAETYFKDIIGMTFPSDRSIHEVVLAFQEKRVQYVKTKALHPSQKILSKQHTHYKEGEFRISLQLMINRDLLREILSFREDVRVISPPLLIEQVKNSLQNALQQY